MKKDHPAVTLGLPWTELSRAITRATPSQCLEMLKLEAAGQARPYIMERCYQSWRRGTNAIDVKLLEKGQLPPWLKKI
jgi:hypothetical protein